MWEAFFTAIAIGAGVGFTVGTVMGIVIALFTRDGIYPNAWATMIIACTVGGVVFSLLEFAVTTYLVTG